MLSRKEPAIARSIQMKKSGRPSAILIRIEDSGRVTSYSALRGYCVLFCFAYSSSCFTIETYEHRQVASTSGGATNAYSRSAKSGEMAISANFTKSTGNFLFFTSNLRMAQESSIKIPPPKSSARTGLCWGSAFHRCILQYSSVSSLSRFSL
jgi:hypothetical protein